MQLTRRHAALGLMAAAGASMPAARAWAQLQASPQDPGDPPTTFAAERDKFEHVMAPVGINGQGPFRFLLDTGANASCVSPALAERL